MTDDIKALPFETDKLIDICRENDVAMVGLFGSLSRGEGDENSDVDLMVRFSKRKSLLSLVKIEREISTALGRKVDLLTEAAISPYLKDRIMKELMVLYEE
jgi:predicted nucleotidyltransferase